MSAPGDGRQNPYDGANQPSDGPPRASFPPQYPGVSQSYPGWYPYGPYPAGPARTNGLATASLVISLISVSPFLPGILLISVSIAQGDSNNSWLDAFVLIGLPAVPCSLIGVVGSAVGIVALTRIRRTKEGGRGRAIGGTAVGVVPLVIVLVFVWVVMTDRISLL